jgi:hypothetical protein
MQHGLQTTHATAAPSILLMWRRRCVGTAEGVFGRRAMVAAAAERGVVRQQRQGGGGWAHEATPTAAATPERREVMEDRGPAGGMLGVDIESFFLFTNLQEVLRY